MKNLSRGAWLAIAAIAAVPATVALAKTAQHADWRMSPETRSRLEDGRLAMVKVALRLTPDQEKLWAPLEQRVRDTFKAREEKRAERIKKREERKAEKADKSEHKHRDLAARYEKISQRLSDRAERMKAFSSAFTPFYASLSDEQKAALRPLMRSLAPGFGGYHGHGPRWAFGGWDRVAGRVITTTAIITVGVAIKTRPAFRTTAMATTARQPKPSLITKAEPISF